jgi:hypothetical protein
MTTLNISATGNQATALGRPIKVYPISLGQKMSSLMSAVIFLGIAFAMLIVLRPMMLNGTGPFQGMNAAGMDTYLNVITLALPALLSLLAVFHLAKMALSWNKAVTIHENGISFRQWGRRREWRWAEIRSIQAQIVRYTYYGFIPAGTLRNYWLYNHNGEILPLTQVYNRVQDLIADVRNAVLPLLLNRATSDYYAGRPVEFGPIQVHQQGIAFSGKVYQWDEVEAVSVNDGRVQISKKGGGWFSGASVDASMVPNLEVLIALLAEIKSKMLS